MEHENVDAMDCWHFIAPLIPVKSDPMTVSIYVNCYEMFPCEFRKGKEK